MNDKPETQNRVPVAGLAVDACSVRGKSPAPCDPIDECVRLGRELAALRTKIGQIAGDYLPDNDSQAPLALGEMREAIFALLEKPSHPAHPDGGRCALAICSASGDETLPDRLRRTTEAMANTPAYVGMELWNDHSNAALDAANEIECLENEVAEAYQRAAAIDYELNALRVKMDSLCCHLNPRK